MFYVYASHNWRAYTVMICNQISKDKVNLTLWSVQIMSLKVNYVISVPLVEPNCKSCVQNLVLSRLCTAFDKELTSQLLIKCVLEVRIQIYRFTTYWIYHFVMWPTLFSAIYEWWLLSRLPHRIVSVPWMYNSESQVDHLNSFCLLLYECCIFRQTTHLTYFLLESRHIQIQNGCYFKLKLKLIKIVLT